MSSSKLLSRHILALHTGGNWTDVNLRDLLSDVDYSTAIKSYRGLNSIATLSFHINYFIKVVIQVLDGGPLEGKDSESFDHPFKSSEQWEAFKQELFADAEVFSQQISALTQEELEADFVDPKYGDLYRQLLGIIEHSHYHMGQISLLKKLMIQKNY